MVLQRTILALAWLGTLTACDREREPEPARTAQAPVEPSPTAPPGTPAQQPGNGDERPAAEQPPEMFSRTRAMMGTVIRISVSETPEATAAPAVEAALDEMARLETVLSEWRDDSEISRINAAAGKHAVEVSEDTLAVVKAGVAVSRWSDGAFDLSWAALHGMYRFERGKERIPKPAALQDRLPLVDHRAVRIDEQARTVELTKPGMSIGTGGIAKGYALDQAARVLEAAGIRNYMLFGGGQVQVSGQRGNRGWRVGVQHPRKDDYFAFVEATSGSISTSGDYEHSFTKDGERWHHIIDTDTGLPVRHTASVTVLAESGLYADALSTAVFVLGAERALAQLDTAPGQPDVLIVDSDMRVHTTAGMRERLVMRTSLTDGKLPDGAPPE